MPLHSEASSRDHIVCSVLDDVDNVRCLEYLEIISRLHTFRVLIIRRLLGEVFENVLLRDIEKFAS